MRKYNFGLHHDMTNIILLHCKQCLASIKNIVFHTFLGNKNNKTKQLFVSNYCSKYFSFHSDEKANRNKEGGAKEKHWVLPRLKFSTNVDTLYMLITKIYMYVCIVNIAYRKSKTYFFYVDSFRNVHFSQ